MRNGRGAAPQGAEGSMGLLSLPMEFHALFPRGCNPSQSAMDHPNAKTCAKLIVVVALHSVCH